MELRSQLKILFAIATIFSAMNLRVFPPVLGKSGGGKKIVHHKSLAAMMIAQSLNFFRQAREEEEPERVMIGNKTLENSSSLINGTSSNNNKVVNLSLVAFKVFATIAKSIVLKVILAIALSYWQRTSEEKWKRNNNINYTNYDDLQSSSSSTSSWSPTRFADPRGLLDSDKCFERMYCWALTSIKWTTFFDMFALKRYLFVPTLYRPPPPMTSRLLNWGVDLKDCNVYHCSPVRFLIRLFIYVVDWNTLLKA